MLLRLPTLPRRSRYALTNKTFLRRRAEWRSPQRWRRPGSGLKAVEPKLQAFYDSLDAKQKKAFDTGGRIGALFDWWGKK
jgi:hypothetical protein